MVSRPTGQDTGQGQCSSGIIRNRYLSWSATIFQYHSEPLRSRRLDLSSYHHRYYEFAPRNSRRPRSRETLAGRRSLPAEPCARWESWRRPDAAFLPAPSFATVQTTNPCDPTAPCQPPGRGRGDLKARQIVLITGSDSMVTCLEWQSHRPPNGMH
jgi:hypothetical protein